MYVPTGYDMMPCTYCSTWDHIPEDMYVPTGYDMMLCAYCSTWDHISEDMYVPTGYDMMPCTFALHGITFQKTCMFLLDMI